MVSSTLSYLGMSLRRALVQAALEDWQQNLLVDGEHHILGVGVVSMREGEILDPYTPLPVVLFKGVGFVPQVLDDLVLGCNSCLQGQDLGIDSDEELLHVLNLGDQGVQD